MRRELTTIVLLAGLVFCLPAQAVILDEEPPKPVAKPKPQGKSRMELENERMKKELQALKIKQLQEDKILDSKVQFEQKTQEPEVTNLTKQATANTFTIAVVPFAMQGVPVDIGSVVESDLKRSNFFKTLDKQNMPSKPSTAEEVQFKDWQALGQNYVVIGQVTEDNGQYNVQFQLFDVYKGEYLMGYRMTSSAVDLRRTAHHISDFLFEKLTGKKGVFSGRIIHIVNGRLGKYQLQISDEDGFNAQTVVSSENKITSPVMSPDNNKIAYISFEYKGIGETYIQSLATGERVKVSSLPRGDDASTWPTW